MKRKLTVFFLCLLLLTLPTLQAHAELDDSWYYEIENGTVIIHGYYGDEYGHVDIPETLDGYTVTTIGNSAFLGREITSVTIPDTVTVIGDFSFAHCPNLQEVKISKNVTFIDIGAFMDCKSLTGIWVDPQNRHYSNDEQGVLYSKDKTTLVQVPASFRDEFNVPEGVIAIGFGAFEGCSSLTAVTLADSVHTIGGYAFCDCSALTELAIPALVEYIGNDAFASCSMLGSMTVAEDNRNFTVDQNGNLCTKDQSQILYVPGAFAGEYVVPEGTKRIGENFMSNCDGLTSVRIPEGVTEIGHYAFAYSENLQSVSIAQSVSEIDAYAFEGCDNLAQVNLPRAVTHIKWGLFRGCQKLTQLPIHDKVTIIDDFAFAECNGLTDIVIPASVTFVGHYAFRECQGLQNVYFLGDAPEFVNHENVNGSFADTVATAYYHKGTEGWTDENKSKTGGYITWVELEHIVPQESEDACCVVCGEQAQRNVAVSIPSWSGETETVKPAPELQQPPTETLPEDNGMAEAPATPDDPATPDAPEDPAFPAAVRSVLLKNNKALLPTALMRAAKTLNPFAVVSVVLLALAAVGWGLYVKQRWFQKKSDA